MKCPTCVTLDLLMTDRQGIEIDYCPQCRGVWLDRGELDKIIERSSRELAQVVPTPVAPPAQAPRYHERPQGYRDNHDDEHKNYRKKSIWHELFD